MAVRDSLKCNMRLPCTQWERARVRVDEIARHQFVVLAVSSQKQSGLKMPKWAPGSQL